MIQPVDIFSSVSQNVIFSATFKIIRTMTDVISVFWDLKL